MIINSIDPSFAFDKPIIYGVHQSTFGLCLIATTENGICNLSFFDDESESEIALNELSQHWPQSLIHQDNRETAGIFATLFPHYNAHASSIEHSDISLLLKGSPFQIKVWKALLEIPEGRTESYQSAANRMGSPKAVRAVASAIARNPVGYLVPCHRVIRSSGETGEYRWGADRKKMMIDWEKERVMGKPQQTPSVNNT